MKVIIENKKLNEIPVITIKKQSLNKKAPVVIIMHGYTGLKEDHIKESYLYAKEGFYVVVYDAYLHGEQKPDSFFDYHNIDIKKVFDIYMRTLSSVDLIIGALESDIMADTVKIGLIGYSMGGNLIFKYLLEGKHNIKAVVTCLSSPKWSNIFMHYFEKYIEKGSSVESEIKKYLMSIEPYTMLDGIENIPLLMLNGDADDIVPVEDVESSYKRLYSNYSRKNLVKLIMYPGLKHRYIPEMHEAVMDWLKIHLMI